MPETQIQEGQVLAQGSDRQTRAQSIQELDESRRETRQDPSHQVSYFWLLLLRENKFLLF